MTSLITTTKTFIALLLVCLTHPAAAQFASTFDTDTEGWWATAGARNGTWNSVGGNPGGYISAEDGLLNDNWYAGSPESWAGDWSSYIGGSVSFDLIDIAQDPEDQLFGGQGTYYPEPWEVVIIMDQDNRARWDADIVPVKEQWTRFEVPLLASTVNLAPTSTETFETIMANASWLLIRGEYFHLDDKTGFDNVVMKPASEPAAFWLLTVGFMGLGFCGRRMTSTKWF